MMAVLTSQENNTAVDIAIFVKSYAPDFPNLKRLLNSCAKFNNEEFPIYICVPDEEIEQLRSLEGICDFTAVPESFFKIDFPNQKIHGRSLGYLRQQIVKLSVHHLGVAANYMILDSDAVMIRPFGRSDFLSESGTPYTVLVEDLDQFTAPWYRMYADRRREFLVSIAKRFELSTDHLRTCHGNVLFSAKVLANFEAWCEHEGLTPSHLMEIGPYEFSWYNFFLQSKMPETVIPIEPFVRYLHVKNEYRFLRYQGITINDLARSYVGICLNSNWAHGNVDSYLRRLTRTSMAYKLSKIRNLAERVVNGVVRRLKLSRG